MFYNNLNTPQRNDNIGHVQEHRIHLESSIEEDSGSVYPLYLNGLYTTNDHNDSQNIHQQNLHIEHHQAITKTLFQNRSVSIINCEYKLKEKYPHLITLIFFFVIYITMILMGASLFMTFEAKAEQRLRDQILNKQSLFLQQNPCIDPKELKQFIKSIIITYDKGVNLALLNDLVDSISSNFPKTTLVGNSKIVKLFQEIPDIKNVSKSILIDKSKSERNEVEEIIVHRNPNRTSSPEFQFIVPTQMSNWEFGSSLTYVASVVTTIGYGHVTPITNEGKILTIVFGAIVIPCTLLFLSVLISIIRDGPIKQIEVWLIKFFGYFTEEVTLLKIRFLHLFIVTIVLFSLLIILPAFLFYQMESQWSFLDSFYYCFITITTVGLGDYVPGQNGVVENRTWYLISIVLYMYIGLCMMMLWIALVLRIPYFNFKTFLVIEEPELLEKKLLKDIESENMLNNEKTPLLSSTTTLTPGSSLRSKSSLSSCPSSSPTQHPDRNSQTDYLYPQKLN